MGKDAPLTTSSAPRHRPPRRGDLVRQNQRRLEDWQAKLDAWEQEQDDAAGRRCPCPDVGNKDCLCHSDTGDRP